MGRVRDNGGSGEEQSVDAYITSDSVDLRTCCTDEIDKDGTVDEESSQ